MKVGLAESITEREKGPRRLRTRIFGGGRPGGGNGKDDGGGDNGGGDSPRPNSYEDAQNSTPDKSKFVAWFLLLVVLMTFGGMIGAYVVISTNGAAEWRPFALPPQVWISTALILLSSLTYHAAKNALF